MPPPRMAGAYENQPYLLQSLIACLLLTGNTYNDLFIFSYIFLK
jgi:hypothetical protein